MTIKTMNSTITIQVVPVPVWAGSGTQNGTKFRVTSIGYDATQGIATGFYSLLSADDTLLVSSSVMATAEQTAAWSDDETFFKVLAANAGLTPV